MIKLQQDKINTHTSIAASGKTVVNFYSLFRGLYFLLIGTYSCFICFLILNFGFDVFTSTGKKGRKGKKLLNIFRCE